MASFSKAYDITMQNEGGYCNDPHDRGGETWRGIARNFWGKWAGWQIVDHVKSTHPAGLNQALGANTELASLVLEFYKKNFWDCLSLDDLKCQQTGNQLFDIAVNMGTGTAAKFLQSAINALIANSFPADGIIGAKTIEAANNVKMQPLYDGISSLRRQRYEQIIAKNPSQAIFKNSWFSRIKPFEASTTESVA